MDTTTLIETDRKKVREKYEKSSKDVERDISTIKEWLKTQQHLPEVPADEVIEFYLTNCKYSIEKTKKVLDMNYTARELLPEIFEDSDPNLPNYQETLPKITTIIPLPKLTDQLYRIIIIKCGENVEIFDPHKIVTHAINVLEVSTFEDLFSALVVIFDNKDMKMAHLRKATPIFFKKVLFLLEKSKSLRIAEIHILNYKHDLVKILLTIAKTVIKKKFMDRIILHENFENLYNYIPKSILPSDYGGTERSLDDLQDLWKMKFREYSDRFDKIKTMKVNESLRSQPLENSETLGYYGHFKKLDVD
ncbi:alpha-tocopherol transfer protein-like [Diorhabda sublineata]|uniref:alpha-tocopherol transfer protein-like n=1 Tax=Diorhabda sublineata TaxID=1163346 RepID=UPI0024E0BE70|nr:alpha-tocopherol transfer protein-like [Diorhabda sublineata]